MSENFLSRWSRRKRAEPEQVEEEDQRLVRDLAPAAPPPAAGEAGAVEVPPPELPPIDSLTPQADFTPFMKPEVPLPMKNAALRKLFADPHFNVMDGLDIYIDDYTRPDPIPEAMLRSLVQSKTLRLFEETEEEAAAAGPATGDPAQVLAAAAPEAPQADSPAMLPALVDAARPVDVSDASTSSTIAASVPAPDAAPR